MVSSDYTKEVGLPSGTKLVPKWLAVAILLALAAGGWFTVRTLATPHHAEAHAAATP